MFQLFFGFSDWRSPQFARARSTENQFQAPALPLLTKRSVLFPALADGRTAIADSAIAATLLTETRSCANSPLGPRVPVLVLGQSLQQAGAGGGAAGMSTERIMGPDEAVVEAGVA